MKKHALKAQKRDVVGRKVKTLRQAGQLPATVYGKKIKSESLSVALADFAKVYQEAGATGLVELNLEGSGRPVLIHNVSQHPVSGKLLHAEFYQVDLKEKVHANVPLVWVGEAPAVAEKKGVLLTLLTEVEVEALPADLPDKIEANVSSLAEVDQELKVADLEVPVGVTLLTDGSLAVVKISTLVSKEAEVQAAAEAAAEAEAAAAAEVAPAEAEAVPAEKEEAKEPTKEEPGAGKPPEEKK